MRDYLCLDDFLGKLACCRGNAAKRYFRLVGSEMDWEGWLEGRGLGEEGRGLGEEGGNVTNQYHNFCFQ